MPTLTLYNDIGNKHDVYRPKDCMNKFFWMLKKTWKENNYIKKEKIKLLTNDQPESYKNATISYICKEKFEEKYDEEI